MSDLHKLIIVIVLGGIELVSLKKLLEHLGVTSADAPSVRASDLMTNAERRVIGYIEQALPHARIHAQVSMGALMQPARGLDKRSSMIARNRFSSKRVDFVAEDRSTGAIIAIIELDDWSHNAANDRWRDSLTCRAGYKTIRLPAGERPTAHSVRERIRQALKLQRP